MAADFIRDQVELIQIPVRYDNASRVLFPSRTEFNRQAEPARERLLYFCYVAVLKGNPLGNLRDGIGLLSGQHFELADGQVAADAEHGQGQLAFGVLDGGDSSGVSHA